MCGVVGSWRYDGGPVIDADIERMLAPIAHRGPDDSGVWTAGNVGLGHRRLSIIDLTAAGHQPMLSADGAGVLSYNGEIYNYRELRRDLEREGVTFRSSSDAEVLLAALHTWGPERSIPLFNGMFAFAYFDRRDDSLWLARDRLGIKQLFTADNGRELHFASEIKALRTLAQLEIGIDPAALRRRLLGRSPGHETLYRGVVGLPPGTWWKVTATGIEPSTYYDFETSLDVARLVAAHRQRDAAGDMDAFRTGLTRSVEMHLASDAPLAAMCSGGVDSSLIAAYAHDAIPNLRGYVADAPIGSGEGDQAERVGRHLGIAIRRIAVGREDYLRLWPLAIWHLDGPTNHPSDPALLAVTKTCREDGIKVLLTGEGADELFGGYPTHATAYRRWKRREWLVRLLPMLVSERARLRWRALPISAVANQDDFEGKLRVAMALDANRTFASGRLFERLSGIEDEADRAFIVSGLADISGKLSRLLHRHDHMGMAASIEMRVPFIENQMIDLGLHLPRGAKRRGKQGKWTEKMVAVERLPRRVVLAKKKGFPMPARYTAGCERLLEGGLLADQLGWTEATSRQLIAGLAFAPDLRFLIVGLEIWLRQSLGGQTHEAIGERLNALAS